VIGTSFKQKRLNSLALVTAHKRYAMRALDPADFVSLAKIRKTVDFSTSPRLASRCRELALNQHYFIEHGVCSANSYARSKSRGKDRQRAAVSALLPKETPELLRASVFGHFCPVELRMISAFTLYTCCDQSGCNDCIFFRNH